MLNRAASKIFIVIVGFASLAGPALAININLQYPAGVLFSAAHDPAAKNAINQAAADISAAITSNLSVINTDVFTGVVGGTTVSFDWEFGYTNPSTGNPATIEIATIAASSVTMFVGSRNLPGSTLGVGGPAGSGYGIDYGYSGIGAFNLAAATAIAESQSEVALKRGGGPVLGTHTDSITLGPQSASFSIDFGIAYGSLALDWSGSGDGNWHFNHTTLPAAGKNDLYSVALHEMLHALGIGTSASWTSNASGSNWTGSEVIDLHGSGANLVGGGHITSSTMSTRISDGLPQEVVMDPNITTGDRKSLTALDLAFLRDIGYSTIIPDIPELSPADFDGDGYVDGIDLATWRNAYDSNANGDTDDDGDTDGRDFLTWQREYTGPSPLSASVVVPEPAAGILIIAGALTLLGCHRR